MEKLNFASFAELLKNPDKSDHSNLIFEFDHSSEISFAEISTENTFKNCSFTGQGFDIIGKNQNENKRTLQFLKCEILIKEITISEGIFQDFIISDSNFTGSLTFDWCYFANCKFQEVQEGVKSIKIKNSDFQNIKIKNLVAEKLFVIASTIRSSGEVKNCKIQDVDFSGSSLSSFYFRNNEVFGYANFELITGKSTSLEISNSLFHKQVNFETQPIKIIYLNQTHFFDIVSFQNAVLKRIWINKVLFEKAVFFEGIELTDIMNCNIKSIRTIKQQLVLTNNNLDYLRFRKIEKELYRLQTRELLFNKDYHFHYEKYRDTRCFSREGEHYSYYIEKNDVPKINRFELLGDYITLSMHKTISNYSTDWKRAIGVTILCGFILYTVFYYTVNYSNDILIDIDTVNDFFNGLPRFFLVTDFKNPLEKNEYYINAISWIPLLIGKIFIAFGIYETIQSFRKFKG
ncbi:hypothetical protein [Salegentibacter mishustinae]|uniref:Pentapeptide repeat-containing protein n=1 Tax=Salegentibacter mishustinae TaxID=270918 RepID=A0A0Q9ZHS3_9FLAO|nr:hypothetical protein [Salegentibacter mishustinae]KRG27699.1 hypothetical protein APR42_08040 [Salegentibacter mishustinae]PNW20768.1 hypothetical protein APB85_05665 [Salegentibacter mishustinae]PZX64230.1 hypothetical protein LY54_02091 [Salegentibacter mishustinae]GGW91010.1 hypothetical protein GCM10008086_20240 [Salegentibacter mishustinae]